MNETDNPPESLPEIPTDFNGLVKLIMTTPELRRSTINAFKKEFSFDIEPLLEKKYGELPDKIHKIEDIETPIREIVEDLVGYIDEDGYSIGQAARIMKISRSMASKLYKEKDQYLKEIKEAVIQELPWHKKILSKFLLKLRLI